MLSYDVKLPYIDLIMLRYVSSIFNLLRAFIMKVSNFVKSFFCIKTKTYSKYIKEK